MYPLSGCSYPATTGTATFTNLSQGVFSRPITSADPADCCVGDQSIVEDGELEALPFSIGEAASESGLVLSASSSSQLLLMNSKIILGGAGANRTVAATPQANRFGSATITITAQTDLSIVKKVFVLSVNAVNDAPTFTKGADIAVAQGSGPQTVSGWATAISPGPNESSQQVSFVVTTDSPHLFSAQPAISAAGVRLSPRSRHKEELHRWLSRRKTRRNRQRRVEYQLPPGLHFKSRVGSGHRWRRAAGRF